MLVVCPLVFDCSYITKQLREFPDLFIKRLKKFIVSRLIHEAVQFFGFSNRHLDEPPWKVKRVILKKARSVHEQAVTGFWFSHLT